MRHIRGIPTPRMQQHWGDVRVQRADALPVSSFRELAEQVAQLSYLNRDHMLFFRGQSRDYRNKASSTTVYPSIYRGERTPKEQLDLQFAVLEGASSRLCQHFEHLGIASHRDLRRRKYIQWSILQHYEVCPTPLLDLTQSLRVACSFAYMKADSNHPVVYVFGLPYPTNRISSNSEHELVNIRLLSICPPEALRPHFQEGYLAGTEDVLAEFGSKHELDFANRLIAKFALTTPSSEFWRDGFAPYPEQVLFPAEDAVDDICRQIKNDLTTGATSGRVGAFLMDWAALESAILEASRTSSVKSTSRSVLMSLDALKSTEQMPAELLGRLHAMRKTRNSVVHRPDLVSGNEIVRATAELAKLKSEFAHWWRRIS